MHAVQRHSLRLNNYETPATAADAVSMLDELGERARLIAGGTDLLLELQRGGRPQVDSLIDVSRIEGMDYIRSDGGALRIGAGATHNEVVRSALVVDHALPLAQACWEIGSPQLRNRATVAGNLVTASPANDTISALLALDAELKLLSVRGERVVRLADFYLGVRKSVLAPDEMVTEIAFPIGSPSRRGVFVKLGLRRAQAISVVHLTCLVDIVEDRVRAARIVLGSVGPVVMSADEAAESLVGNPLTDDAIRTASQLAREATRPIDDIRSTGGYRVEMTEVMVKRALEVLSAGRERERWPLNPVTLGAGTRSQRRESVGQPAGPELRAVVNGVTVVTPRAVSKTLLGWLREDAGPALGVSLTGTKEGCAEGECGACTMYLDGYAVMACLIPAGRAHGSTVVTIEGLSEDQGDLHSLQRTFIEHGAVQCGFCTPGLVMAGAKLLEERATPTLDEIRVGLSGNLCRCTGYYKIITAVESAARAQEGKR